MAQMQRKLSLWDSVFIGLGSILGAGVFVVTGVALEVAGPAMLVGLMLAGFGALMNALSVAQLARVYPLSGGTYIYAGRKLNPWAGFAAGWMFLVSKLAAGAVVALSFGQYLKVLLPGVSMILAALGLVLILTLVNLLGVKKASWFNALVVSFTLLVLSLVVVLGIGRVEAANFTPFAPAGLGGILQGGALLFFAYTGYARIATLGEEVQDPGTNIPRAILLALGGAGIMYVLVSVVLVGTISPLTGGGLWQVAEGLPWLGLLVSMAAITAMISVLLGQVMGISRMLYAMAGEGDLPRFLGRVHQRYDVPHLSLVLTCLVICLLVVTGGLRAIVSMASFAILFYYALANISALRLQEEERLYSRVFSGLGLILCLVLALALDREVILTGLLILGLGLGFRLVYRRVGGKA